MIVDHWQQQIERELHAEVRAFRSVAHAVLWYATQRKRRETAGGLGSGGGGAMSAAQIDQQHATYARIASCLAASDEVDDKDHRWGTLQRIAGGMMESRATVVVVDAMLGNLVSYYLSSAERGGQRMLDEVNDELHRRRKPEMSAYKLSQWMGRIESVLWRRFVACGLLPGLPEAEAVGAFLRWGTEC